MKAHSGVRITCKFAWHATPSTTVFAVLNMASVLATIYNSVSFGNVLLFLLLLLMLHYLMVLYDFRNMPPGPRLTTIPVLGNAFSLDLKAEKLTDAFKRSVFSFPKYGATPGVTYHSKGTLLRQVIIDIFLMKNKTHNFKGYSEDRIFRKIIACEMLTRELQHESRRVNQPTTSLLRWCRTRVHRTLYVVRLKSRRNRVACDKSLAKIVPSKLSLSGCIEGPYSELGELESFKMRDKRQPVRE